MEILGGLAGAVLSEITFSSSAIPLYGMQIPNPLGSAALLGYQAGAKLTRMAQKRKNYRKPLNKKKRVRSNTWKVTSTRPSKRKSSGTQTVNYIGSSAKTQRIKNVGASTTIHTVGRVKKRKPNVKVSKTLRQKIQKVISGKEIMGITQEIAYDVMRWVGPTESNRQIVHDCTAMSRAARNDPMFSNDRILDAASCLWNNKPQLYDKLPIHVQNFNSQKLKVKVINSTVTYTFKNNTQRDCNMKLLECRPVSAQFIGDPFGIWVASLTTNAAGEGSNQSNIAITELHTSPTMLPQFKKLMKVHTIDVHIPPGGLYHHTVQGPKDKMCDFTKYWNGSTFQPYTSDSCWLLAVYCPDLVTTDNGLYGRYINPMINTAGAPHYGIVLETVSRYKMEIPEQAGFNQSPALPGAGVPLDQRQWSYAFRTYTPGGLGDGQALTINDEIPTDRPIPN